MLTVKNLPSRRESPLDHAASPMGNVRPDSVSQSHSSDRQVGKAGAKTTASNSSPELKGLAA